MGMKKNCDPKKITVQLRRIEGQVRAVERMYNEKRDIEEIVRVVKAARSSLDSVTKLLVDDKVSGCYDGKKVVKKQELSQLIKVLFDIT
jgi:DNA-binding FrmR family transcriptional regulator